MYSDELIATLQRGGIAVLRTDTLYGIVGSATNEATVARIYATKERTPTKSPIVLIAGIDQLLDSYDETWISGLQLERFWPGPNSIILPSPDGPEWLTRGNASIAYRMPASEQLRELLRRTGPLVAPSANPEGQPPASTVAEAKQYFDDAIDWYEDGGEVTTAKASNLLRIHEDGTIETLR